MNASSLRAKHRNLSFVTWHTISGNKACTQIRLIGGKSHCFLVPLIFLSLEKSLHPIYSYFVYKRCLKETRTSSSSSLILLLVVFFQGIVATILQQPNAEASLLSTLHYHKISLAFFPSLLSGLSSVVQLSAQREYSCLSFLDLTHNLI